MSTSSPASRIQANLQELFQGNVASGDAYIKFQLTPEINALLSMAQVQESLIVEAEQITSLPTMPNSFVGMMNSRDRVFCVFDLAQLLALPSELINSRQYQVIVLQTMNQPSEPAILIGLAVTQLQGIVRLPIEQIQSSLEDAPANLADFMAGMALEKGNKIPILELNRLLASLK
ncbi:MAG: chemotaxis protein CheW [Pleurocapsa minor HA4230-MV1]|jgi:twitching motility protein PilI|nr:chemotaxis protein CheW [Pleurocapsa minor HA4230-MV1]